MARLHAQVWFEHVDLHANVSNDGSRYGAEAVLYKKWDWTVKWAAIPPWEGLQEAPLELFCRTLLHKED